MQPSFGNRTAFRELTLRRRSAPTLPLGPSEIIASRVPRSPCRGIFLLSPPHIRSAPRRPRPRRSAHRSPAGHARRRVHLVARYIHNVACPGEPLCVPRPRDPNLGRSPAPNRSWWRRRAAASRRPASIELPLRQQDRSPIHASHVSTRISPRWTVRQSATARSSSKLRKLDAPFHPSSSRAYMPRTTQSKEPGSLPAVVLERTTTRVAVFSCAVLPGDLRETSLSIRYDCETWRV